MIKFRAQGMYGFGLSFENLDRLRAGEPINIDLAEMGGSGTVLIFAGTTEAEMAHQLEDFIGPATTAHIDPRLKS